MDKKYISVGLITYVVLTLAAPLFSSEEDCEMPCCTTVETSCCMKQEITDCPLIITSCEIPVALMLISGLEAQTTKTVEISTSQPYDVTTFDIGIEYYITSDIQNSSVSPPISFLTPLRI